MPTYGYRCPSCSAEFDVWQKMSDEPGAPCPKCGTQARRLFFPAGIVFKGTGFYATDSRASNGTSKSSNGTKPQPSADKSGDSTATKPDTTATTKSGGD